MVTGCLKMSKVTAAAGVLCVFLAVMNTGCFGGKKVYANSKLAASGNDPWVILHDGTYYYCYSEGNSVKISSSDSLSSVCRMPGKNVWTATRSTGYFKDVWAPELHFIDGCWYVYVAADDGNNGNHRMLCLQCTTAGSPENFSFKGIVRSQTDRWAIDGTVLAYNGRHYFVWSGWEGTENVQQNLYIARMQNPWTISGDRVCISSPEYDWEKKGYPFVNEGPEALVINGSVHIVYSASGSWTDDYCLGMLTLTGSDPLDSNAWFKNTESVFSKSAEIFGPGHASFTTSPDGSRHFIVYHANELSGTGWKGRSVWAQEFTVTKENYPVFGEPAGACRIRF
jgi:GH43 family beta-xylosidase